MEYTLLWDIGLIIFVATILSYIVYALRQSLIVAYVFAGILIGPIGLGLIVNQEVIVTLSELGIAFLLFIVGLELDLRRLKNIGTVAFLCGGGQIIFTFFTSMLIASQLGFPRMESIYIALALTFSSTMVVIKLLSDKDELDTLHGRIVTAILLIQDVVVILALALLTHTDPMNFLKTPGVTVSVISGLGLFSIAILASRVVLPFIFRFFTKSQELLFLSVLSWVFIFSAIAYQLNLSIAIGAFLGGIGLAYFPYNIEVASMIRSLRDFFATLFFVSLGMQLVADDLSTMMVPAIVFSVFVLLSKPLIILVLVSMFGYGRRISFLSGISLAQISEFSLILVSAGVLAGNIRPEIMSLVALIAVVTIIASSYFIEYDEKIYRRLSRYLMLFERTSHRHENLVDIPTKSSSHAIVFGGRRMGYYIMEQFKSLGKDFLVVDFNPDVIEDLMRQGIPCIYGDMGDVELLDRVDLKDAEIIISTVMGVEDNYLLIEETRKVNSKALLIVTANSLDDALELYNFGADYVIIPRMLAGEQASQLIKEYVKSPKKLFEAREKHVVALEMIKEEELLDKYEPAFLKSLENKFNLHSPKK